MPARFELSISTPDLEREWGCSTPAQVFAVLAHYREIMEDLLVIEHVGGAMYAAMGTDWYTMNITGYTCPTDAPWLYPVPVDWTEALDHVDMEEKS